MHNTINTIPNNTQMIHNNTKTIRNNMTIIRVKIIPQYQSNLSPLVGSAINGATYVQEPFDCLSWGTGGPHFWHSVPWDLLGRSHFLALAYLVPLSLNMYLCVFSGCIFKLGVCLFIMYVFM